MTDARLLFEQASSMFEAARQQSKAELAQSEARVARLKAALACKEAGDDAEHDRIVAEVRAEQERLGILS